MRLAPLAFLLMLPYIGNGQEMLLSQGVIQVRPGTVIEIHGPVLWTIASGAQLINDGRIEFKGDAQLFEAPGAPIIGQGTEHAWIEANMPVTALAPGGLGLEFTSASPIGPLEVVRGHEPREMENGQQSVARWYRLPDGTPPPLDVLIFRFDETESNNLNGAQLDLHDSENASAPWVPMLAAPGTDLLSLTAFNVVPREHITAFHLDAATTIPENAPLAAFHVWPTISSGLVNLGSAGDEIIEHVELFDIRGRQLPLHVENSTGGQLMVIDLSRYESGPLILRVNGRLTYKLVKA